MKIMKINFRKLVGGVLLAGALSVTGTYTWTSMSQRADNKLEASATPGVRLHDDFDMETGNKDIYVENFGDTPVAVRVKLYEYMEINGQSLIPGADPDDVTTWSPYIATSSTSFGTDTEKFRDYVEVVFGEPRHKNSPVDSGKVGQTYLPTFNMDSSESFQESDASGDGLEFVSKLPTALGDGTEGYFRLGEYYENNDSYGNMTKRFVSELMTTRGGSFYDVPNFISAQGYTYLKSWLIDDDGWCYFTSPVLAEKATSVLVDEINYNSRAYTSIGFEYHLCPVLETVTLDKVSQLYNDGITTTLDALTNIWNEQLNCSLNISSITMKPGEIKVLDDIKILTPEGKYYTAAVDDFLGRRTIETTGGNEVSPGTYIQIGKSETADKIEVCIFPYNNSTKKNCYLAWLTIIIDHS